MRNPPSRSSTFSRHLLLGWLVIALVAFPVGVIAQEEKSDEPNGTDALQIEEASIGDIQRAIQQGETTCMQVVEAYVERARAYNGVCTQLVTADGGRVAPGRGAVRAGAPIEFPATTVPVREILPEYDEYRGAADRVRPHGAHAVRPRCPAAVRHGRRHAGRGSTQCAEHAQPAWRAIGDLPGPNAMRTRRSALCPRIAPRHVKRFDNSLTRSREQRSWTPCTAGIPTSTGCRCTVPRSRSRTSSTPPTCGRQAAPIRATRWMPHRRTRRSSPSCALGAPSSTPRPTSPSTTPAVGTRGAPLPDRGRSARASLAAVGPVRRAMSTIRPGSPAVRAPGQPCRSARTSPPAPSVRRRVDRAGNRPGETASSAS